MQCKHAMINGYATIQAVAASCTYDQGQTVDGQRMLMYVVCQSQQHMRLPRADFTVRDGALTEAEARRKFYFFSFFFVCLDFWC